MNIEPSPEERNEINVQGWVKVLILFGLAGYFAYIITTGTVTNYVNERFGWLSIVAMLLFAGLGVASTISVWQRQNDPVGPGQVAEPSWPVLLIVAGPLLLGTLIPSQPLGAEAINGNLSTSGATIGGANMFTRDPLDRNILDWLRVFNDEPSPAASNGEPADVTGFVYREPGLSEDQFLLARFAVSCCVADASAFALPVVWAGTADLPEGQWVRVQGEFEAGMFREDNVPILIPHTVERVAQPEHPYLYP